MVQNCVQKLRDWKACHFDKLPTWMRDNEYLHFGHRPQVCYFQLFVYNFFNFFNTYFSYQVLQNAFDQFLEFTQKLETYGPI